MAENFGFIIDSPVSAFSQPFEVKAWLDELSKLPQGDPSVQMAVKEAQDLLVLVSKRA